MDVPDGGPAPTHGGDEVISFGCRLNIAESETIRALLDRPLPVVPASGSCAGDGYELFASDEPRFACSDALEALSAKTLILSLLVKCATLKPSVWR